MALKKRNIANQESSINQNAVSKEYSAAHPDVFVEKFDEVKTDEDDIQIDWDDDDNNPATGRD